MPAISNSIRSFGCGCLRFLIGTDHSFRRRVVQVPDSGPQNRHRVNPPLTCLFTDQTQQVEVAPLAQQAADTPPARASTGTASMIVVYR